MLHPLSVPRAASTSSGPSECSRDLKIVVRCQLGVLRRRISRLQSAEARQPKPAGSTTTRYTRTQHRHALLRVNEYNRVSRSHTSGPFKDPGIRVSTKPGEFHRRVHHRALRGRARSPPRPLAQPQGLRAGHPGMGRLVQPPAPDRPNTGRVPIRSRRPPPPSTTLSPSGRDSRQTACVRPGEAQIHATLRVHPRSPHSPYPLAVTLHYR